MQTIDFLEREIESTLEYIGKYSEAIIEYLNTKQIVRCNEIITFNGFHVKVNVIDGIRMELHTDAGVQSYRYLPFEVLVQLFYIAKYGNVPGIKLSTDDLLYIPKTQKKKRKKKATVNKNKVVKNKVLNKWIGISNSKGESLNEYKNLHSKKSNNVTRRGRRNLSK